MGARRLNCGRGSAARIRWSGWGALDQPPRGFNQFGPHTGAGAGVGAGAPGHGYGRYMGYMGVGAGVGARVGIGMVRGSVGNRNVADLEQEGGTIKQNPKKCINMMRNSC
jgi:hypothetical protein